MPRKSYDEKNSEIVSAAGYAYSWLKGLPEYKKALAKHMNGKPTMKEIARDKSIFGFVPEEPNNVFPLDFVVVLQKIQKTPFIQESVILSDPLNYDLCDRTKEGKLIGPNDKIYNGPIGLPPKRITLLIYWDYPILNILHKIEAIIKQVKHIHQIANQRPRNKQFILRICNKRAIYKNKRTPTKTLILEINWLLCPSVIIKYLRPVIDQIIKKYKIPDSRPQYATIADRYKSHVMAKLGYPKRQIQAEILKRFSINSGADFLDPSDAHRKYAERIAKKGISPFL